MLTWLKIATNIFLSFIISVSNININLKDEKKSLKNNNINLSVEPIIQENNYYSVPACIQMIFRYLNINISQYTQHRIFQDLNGTVNIGLSISEETSNYLNIHTTSLFNYNFTTIPLGFGREFYEQLVFQNYVYNSLLNNHPLIFGFKKEKNFEHAVIISGIILNLENPFLTQYVYINPINSSINYFEGRMLSSFFSATEGHLIGNNSNPDFNKKNVSIVIDSKEIGRNDLNDYKNYEVHKIRIDLTATLGIKRTGDFSNIYKQICLNEFNGEIYNFTWRKKVTNLTININYISTNNDNWKSPLIKIAESSEDIGSAHIEGRILVQLVFERTKTLNHLLIYIVIYVGGISWATRNWAHVWFKTGEILSFIKK